MKSLCEHPPAYSCNHLVATNHQRSRETPENEVLDTGIFPDAHY
jgi:hypothetical protein